MPNNKQNRLELIECARGLAAFSVVIFHANATSHLEGWRNFPWFTVFQYGVDFFFVLSGFIIYFAHGRDFGNPARLRNYVSKRAIRLLPTLWLVTSMVFVLRMAASMPVENDQFIRSLLPYPSLLSTNPPVVWTLRHEFIFYVVIALAIYSRRLGIATLTLWAFASVVQLILMIFGRQVEGLPSFFLSSYSLDFMIGIGIAKLHESRSFKASFAPFLSGLLLLVVALWLDLGLDFHRSGPTDYVTSDAGWFTLALGISFGIILHGLLILEGRIRAPRFLVGLGASTYALYLIHTPVNGVLVLLMKRTGSASYLDQGLGAILLVFFGTLAGLALHQFFERPLGSWLRRQAVPPTVRPTGVQEG